MASTRYATIVHTIVYPHGNQSQHRINLRFKNAKARVTYEEQFDAYHASHEHEGPAPFFLETTATELGSNVALSAHPAELVTLDGYKAHEILEYHQAIEDRFQVVRYQPPTCCVPPLVALNNQFADLVRADTFERHELSTAFQDMPDDEFMSLIESITAKGIIDNIIKIHEGQILDGWHRYRACQELGILRKLRFQVWNTEKDGDPLDYVIAKNLDRRRHTASQVAQILLELTNRYGHGGDRSKVSKRDLETLETIAKRGNVSVSTMKRAAAVQKLDPETVESVKQGKVSATKALDAAKKDALIDQITANVSAFRNLYVEHYKKGITSLKEMFTAGITEFNLPKEGIAITLENPTGSYTDIKTLQRIQDVTDRLIKDWTGQPKAGWIRKCLQTEDQKKAELWEKIDARLPKWKERLSSKDDKEDVSVENLTLDLLIEHFRAYLQRNKALYKYEIGTAGSPLSLAELTDFYKAIRQETFSIIFSVRKALLASVVNRLPLQDAVDEMKTSERGDSLEIALQKWKEKRNHLPHLADATVSMVVNAAKRYDDIPAEVIIAAERVVTLLGSGVVIFQLYVEKLLAGVDIFKIPNNLSLAEVEAFGTASDADTLKQAKLDHVRAQTGLQEAFFTAIDMDEGEEDVMKFFAAVVDHCIPKLRLNIFSDDFYYDTRTDRDTEFSDMYRGRDLTLEEIQKEIKMLEGIVREVEWWKADEGRVPRWMDDVVKAITPPTEESSEKAQIDNLLNEIEEKVNGQKTVADLLGENREMWSIIIEWKRTDTDDYEKLAFMEKSHYDARSRPLSLLPDRLVAELLAIAMPEQAENAALGWEAGYSAADRHAFSEAYTAWTHRHKSELSKFPELTGEHVCKAYQRKFRNLQTNVIMPTDYNGTRIAMNADDEKLLEGLRELHGGIDG